MALIDGGQLDEVRRSNEEREILHGRKSTLSYRPMEGAVERSPVTEQIRHGESGTIPYQPLERSNFNLPPLGGAGGAGGSAEPNIDWSQTAEAGAIGTSTRWPGNRGAGGVLQMSMLEVAAGLAGGLEAMSGGRLGADTRRALEGQIGDVFRSLRPEVQADLSREFTDLGAEGVLRNPSAFGYQLLKQVPILASLAIPGIGGGVAGGRLAAGAALRRGASETAVTAARRAGVTAGATVGGAAGESAVVGGMTAGQIMSGIENAPDNVLMEAPKYRAMRERGMSEGDAKRALMTELGRREGRNVAAGSVLLNIIPARILGRIMSGATTTRRGLGEALVAQPITEALQEPFEGYREDVAAQESYDPSRMPGEDTLERSVAGAALGLGSGAAIVGAGYVGRRIAGLDRIEDDDTKGQQLGDPAIEAAIPVKPPPSPQGSFDFGDTGGGPRGPQPADMGPPRTGPAPPPEGMYNTRRGEQRGIPEEPVVEPEQPFTRAFPEQEYTTRGGETRTAPAQPSSGGPRAEPANVQRYRQLTTRLAEDGILNPDTGGIRKPGKAREKYSDAEKARIDEHSKLRKELGEDILRDTLEGMRQTGMDLPAGEATDAMRRGVMQDAERTATRALPAPAADTSTVGADIHARETMLVRGQIGLLEDKPTRTEDETKELRRLRGQLRRMENSPEGIAAKERAEAREREQQQAESRQRAETRRERAAGTATESGPAIAEPRMPEPVTDNLTQPYTVTRPTTGGGFLKAQDTGATKARLDKLTNRARQLEDRAKKRALSRKEQRQLDQLTTEISQLQAETDQFQASSDQNQLQQQVRDAQQAVDAALAEAERLAAEPPPKTKAGRVNAAGLKRLQEARTEANATLTKARGRLSEAQKAADMEQTRRDRAAPKPTQRQPENLDLFGEEQTSDSQLRADWNAPTTRDPTERLAREDAGRQRPNTAETRKRQVIAAVRSAITQMVGDGASPARRSLARATTRLQAKVMRAMRGKRSKEDILSALGDVVAKEGAEQFGQYDLTTVDILERAHRVLTGNPLPRRQAVADVTEAALVDAPRESGRTGVPIEGADPSETEYSPPVTERTLSEAQERAEQAAEEAQEDIEILSDRGDMDEVTAEIAELMADREAAQQIVDDEVADTGALTDETNDMLEEDSDLDLSRDKTDIQNKANAEALAMFTQDDVDRLLDRNTDPLQQLADSLDRGERDGLIHRLLELYRRRQTTRMLRQTLAVFGKEGILHTHPEAREVLTRWRGDVMLFALQQGNSDLQGLLSLLSESAPSETQAVRFLKVLDTLATDYPDLNVSIKDVLSGKDTDMLVALGEMSDLLNDKTDLRKLGEQINYLTDKTNRELLAMPSEELRKLISSRLGVPLPRKGVMEKGYTVRGMVHALREYEKAMRSIYESFVERDPDIRITADEWKAIVIEGLRGTDLSNKQFAAALRAFNRGFNNGTKVGGQDLPAGPAAAMAEVVDLLETEFLPTSDEAVAKALGMTRREARAHAASNRKRVTNITKRINQEFRKSIDARLKDVGRMSEEERTGFTSRTTRATQVADAIRTERDNLATRNRQEGLGRSRLARQRAKQREQLINAYDSDIAVVQNELGESWTQTQIKNMYRRHGLPVPGEPWISAEVQGGQELVDARVSEGRLFFGNDVPLEQRLSELPTNWYNRLDNADAARAYASDENAESLYRKANPSDPEPTAARVRAFLRTMLTERAESGSDNAAGRLTDAQFAKLLVGLGLDRAMPGIKIGEKFDRKEIVTRILNSVQAFGAPIFTGGSFVTEFVRPRYQLGESQTTIISALNRAHSDTLRALARYFNNDNAVEGTKSQMIEFIMNSDKMQALWAETASDRAMLEAQDRRFRKATGQLQPRHPHTGGFVRHAAPTLEESTTPVTELSKAEKGALAEAIRENLAELTRLMDRYVDDARAYQVLAAEFAAAQELMAILESPNPEALARKQAIDAFNEATSGMEQRIEKAKQRIKALQKEIRDARKSDPDYIGNAVSVPGLSIGDMAKAKTRLDAFIKSQQALRTAAKRRKDGVAFKEAGRNISRATALRKLVVARTTLLKQKESAKRSDALEANAKLLDKYIESASQAVAPDTTVEIMESSLSEHQGHLSYLEQTLFVLRKDYESRVEGLGALTTADLFAMIREAEAKRVQMAQDIATDVASRQQMADETSTQDRMTEKDLTAEWERKRQAARNARVRQAQVWPRMDASLATLIEWADTANRAFKKLRAEIKINSRKDATNAGLVTTSSMETVAPYSNEMVVGGRPLLALFLSTDYKNSPDMEPGLRSREQIDPMVPRYLRGAIQRLLKDTKSDDGKGLARAMRLTVAHGKKTYVLSQTSRSEIGKIRAALNKELRDLLNSANPNATAVASRREKLEKIDEYMTFDTAMRAAYAEAYSMIGDIHLASRASYAGKGVPMEKALADLAKGEQTTVTTRAEPVKMTPKQKRAAQEQERQAAQAEVETTNVEVPGWVDQSPEAELAALDKAISKGEILPGYANMGRQIYRQRQLRQALEQTIEQAQGALSPEGKKQHMDLPIEQARDFIAGSSYIAQTLISGRSRPTTTREVLRVLRESGTLAELPTVTRLMLEAAERFGMDIPVRWVNSAPIEGKTFFGRFVFDRTNPTQGREILINGRVFDALMNKEQSNDPELGHWNTYGRVAHVFVHELAHAMTHLSLLTDPNLQREFGTLMGIARRAMGWQRGDGHHGLSDVFEFVAEYFSNEAFQRDLQKIRINQDGTAMSLWQRITDMVRSLFNLPRQTTTMFQYIMDRSSALFMSPQMAQQFAATNTPYELAQGYLNYEVTMDAPGAAMANAAELAAEQASRWNWVVALESGLRKTKLGFMTLDQIGESYAGLASKYTDLQNKKWAEVNRNMDSANRLMQDFSALGGEVADRLSTVMLKATNFAIHPDQPRGPNSPNAHLSNSPRMVEIYTNLKAEYDALPAEAKEIYQRVKERHANDYATMSRYVTSNIMAAFNFDVDNLPTNWYEKLQATEDAKARHEYLSDLWDKYGLPDEKTGKKSERGFSEQEADALARLARRPKMLHGPYFPMSRFGKYVVRARAELSFNFQSEAEMAQVLGEIKDREPGAQFEGFAGDSLSGTVTFQLTEMYDRQGEANKRHAQLFKEQVYDMNGEPFGFGGKPVTWNKIPGVAEKSKLAMHELSGHYSSSFLTRMQDKLKGNPAALAAAKEAYLQMLPDTSVRKLELRRARVQGATTDMIRSFAAVTKAAAYGNAQVKYGRLLSDEMQAMNQRVRGDYQQQAVVQELQKRDMNSTNLMSENMLGSVMDRATEAGFVWFLGSPSYWMINATQPYMLTLPYLSARYGTKASYAALARARKMVFPTLAGKATRSGFGLKAMRRDPKAHREFMRDIFGGLDDLFKGVTDPNTKAMLQEVEQMGLIDLTIAKDLNQTIQQAGTGTAAKAWESIVDTTRVMPHLVEVLNRSMTAIAAYDLATRKGLGHEQAVQVAIDVVRKTQFNYSAVNKARFMSRTSSELLRPIMLFQQYAQHVYYLMLRSAIDGFSAAKTPEQRKEARKTFYRIIGAHTVAAGTLGGMFEPIRAAAGLAFAAAQLVGLADEDDDFESWWQRMGKNAFGETGGRVFSKGVPYGLLNADLYGRLGMNNLITMSDPRVKGMEGSEWLMHSMFGILGPLGSTAASFADIPQKWRRGDYYGAIASASPKALRDLMQANAYQDTGILDYTGNVIMRPEEIDGMSLGYKMAGIAPSPVSQMYSSRSATRRVEARINKKRTRLMERWRRTNTPAARQNVLNDIYEFNKNYPEFIIDGEARIKAKARKRENEVQAARQGGYYSGANAQQQRRVQQYGDF